MATEVTNTELTINTIAEVDYEAATSTTADEEETFQITPEAADSKVLLLIKNTATDQGSITVTIAEGDLWAGVGDKEVTVEQGKEKCINVEGGKYLDEDGILNVTLTPATGKKLLTDHAAAVACVVLP